MNTLYYTKRNGGVSGPHTSDYIFDVLRKTQGGVEELEIRQEGASEWVLYVSPPTPAPGPDENMLYYVRTRGAMLQEPLRWTEIQGRYEFNSPEEVEVCGAQSSEWRSLTDFLPSPAPLPARSVSSVVPVSKTDETTPPQGGARLRSLSAINMAVGLVVSIFYMLSVIGDFLSQVGSNYGLKLFLGVAAIFSTVAVSAVLTWMADVLQELQKLNHQIIRP